LPQAIVSAAGMTASRTIRNMATLGGDIAGNLVQSPLVPVLMVLEASLICMTGHGEQTHETAVADYRRLDSAPLIVEVTVPKNAPPAELRCVSRTSHSRKSLVCSASARYRDGVIEEIRIAAGDCVGAPIRLPETEGMLAGASLPEKTVIETAVSREFHPEPDFHASAEYKRYLAGVHVADILHDLREGGGTA
jgi:putative selenate reductase FAD-binding subunit